MAWECRTFLNPFIKNFNEVVRLYKVFTSVPRICWLSIMQFLYLIVLRLGCVDSTRISYEFLYFNPNLNFNNNVGLVQGGSIREKEIHFLNDKVIYLSDEVYLNILFFLSSLHVVRSLLFFHAAVMCLNQYRTGAPLRLIRF